MNKLGIERQKPILALDLDNVVFQTSAHMEALHGIKMESLDETENEVRKKIRLNYLRNPEHILGLSLHGGILIALPILKASFDIHVLSARSQAQEDILISKLDLHGLSQYISGMHLRPVNDERGQKIFKLETAEEIGIEYAIEDYGPLAVAMAESIKGVILPDRLWNRNVRAPNIFRCRELFDFSLMMADYDSPQSFFEKHALSGAHSNGFREEVYEAVHLGRRISILVAVGQTEISKENFSCGAVV